METFRNRQKRSRSSRGDSKAEDVSSPMREKLAITFVVIMLALFALTVKLWSIQNEYSDEYNQKILAQQNYDSRDIPYRRGDIVDRNGTFLASSTKVYNLILDPSQINSNQEDYLEPTIGLLCEEFGYDAGELRNLITSEKPESAYIRYDRQLSYDQMTAFETHKQERNQEYKSQGDPHRIYGVWFEDSYQRYYPNNSLACNVIGFSLSDGSEGSGGIEQYYNDELIGVSGREYGYLNDDSNLERVIKPAIDGNTVVSTIDANIQGIVEKYVDQFETETGAKTVGCVVMDPSSGEVLAMASNREFDLNNPRDLNKYYTEAELKNLSDEELSDVWNQVWRNYCVSDTYEPGSTSKIFTVAAALEEGSINGNETYLCDGFQEVSGWKIKCNNTAGHGILTVKESLMQSCNDAMMQIVAGLGRDKFTKFMKIFGFGRKTGIDLPGEADTSQLVHSAATMVASDLATNAFGQNYNCTMIQMAAAYCSVINGGSYYEPHVVKRIQNSAGNTVRTVEPKLVCQTVSHKTSEFIKDALFDTVNKGTGGAAMIAGYDIGGKTGTAEKYPRGENRYLVSFAGFAPIDDPQVLCYVIVDEPMVEDQAHSTYASGIFRNIMREVLPYQNVYRAGNDEDYPPEDNIDNLLREEAIISAPPETREDGSVVVTEAETLPGAPPSAEETEPVYDVEHRREESASEESVPETLPAAEETTQADTSGEELTPAETVPPLNLE